MPNWNLNNLEVSGPKKELDAFIKKVRVTGILQFDAIVPMPEELAVVGGTPEERAAREAINLKKFGFPDWYLWSVANWGTKWDLTAEEDCSDRFERINGNVATFSFDTAWSPPTRWLAAAAKMFPKLLFVMEYGESGMCFAGQVTFKQGKLAEDVDYPSGSDRYKEICGWDEDDAMK